MKTLILLLIAAAACARYARSADFDANGLSDVFESVYFSGPADPNSDPDGDGLTNAEEAAWGTNPTDAESVITGPSAILEGADIQLNWPAVVGKWFRLQASADLQTWTTVTEGSVSTWREPTTSTVRFWRLQVLTESRDVDANGLDDWEEALWHARFGQPPAKTDIDGDGLTDAEELAGGHSPTRKDHPAVGLIVFTPLEQ